MLSEFPLWIRRGGVILLSKISISIQGVVFPEISWVSWSRLLANIVGARMVVAGVPVGIFTVQVVGVSCMLERSLGSVTRIVRLWVQFGKLISIV